MSVSPNHPQRSNKDAAASLVCVVRGTLQLGLVLGSVKGRVHLNTVYYAANLTEIKLHRDAGIHL